VALVSLIKKISQRELRQVQSRCAVDAELTDRIRLAAPTGERASWKAYAESDGSIVLATEQGDWRYPSRAKVLDIMLPDEWLEGHGAEHFALPYTLFSPDFPQRASAYGSEFAAHLGMVYGETAAMFDLTMDRLRSRIASEGARAYRRPGMFERYVAYVGNFACANTAATWRMRPIPDQDGLASRTDVCEPLLENWSLGMDLLEYLVDGEVRSSKFIIKMVEISSE
jgi:hypothetical protein